MLIFSVCKKLKEILLILDILENLLLRDLIDLTSAHLLGLLEASLSVGCPLILISSPLKNNFLPSECLSPPPTTMKLGTWLWFMAPLGNLEETLLLVGFTV